MSATLVDFAQEHLFEPLEIDDYSWVRFEMAPELTFASGGASLRPRDMAKLGALYLNDGVWNGTRVLSTEWVRSSTTMSIPLAGDYGSLYGYGFNWWLGRFTHRGNSVDYYRAAGWGGQDVYAVADLNLVVVFTAGGYYASRPLSASSMIEGYILPAIAD